MTSQDKELIFKYLGWIRKDETPERAIIIASIIHKLGAEDMVEAIRIMEKKGDLEKFEEITVLKWLSTKTTYLEYITTNFFTILLAWRKGEIK